MDIVSITLNLVCLFFFLLLVFVYFSKKKKMTIENIIYLGILFCVFCFIVTELLFLYSCYYFRDYFSLIDISERLSSAFLVIFFILIIFYAIFICTENNIEFKKNVKKKRNIIYLSLVFSFILIFIAEFILPMYYVYKDGIIHYAYGPALDGVAIVVAIILLIVFVPILIKNWKHTDIKKLSPLLVVTILEVITLIVSVFAPSLCLATVSLTSAAYLMYMTIENPDAKLVKELELAKNQAEKANNAKSDFLSSMSHELRTPLNAIVGLSQMIESSTQEVDTKNDVKDILKASNNLLELVDGILDINKLEANQMELVKTRYDTKEIFYDLDRMIKIRIGDKKIELRTRISDNIPSLYGDKDKIKRIVFNILTNAVKYTEEGYIDFVVDAAIVKDKCNLRISVSDTGRGMSDEQLEQLFTKFNRRKEDKDSDIEGTGLGLAITKSLVDLMDGKISVNSTIGMGSTFTITLSQQILNNNIESI